MIDTKMRIRSTILGLAAALLLLPTMAVPVAAQHEPPDLPDDTPDMPDYDDPRTDETRMKRETPVDIDAEDDEAAEERKDADELLDEAVVMVEKMKADPQVHQLLQNAKGVFLVPDYGKGAFVVGARGGSGVMLARTASGWSSPAFYDIGGISLGAQIGLEAGELAMALMTDEAVHKFYEGDAFSLDADAGLTIVNYSAKAQGSIAEGNDVIVWSDTAGALIDASVSISDISYDDEENSAYYGSELTAQQILSQPLMGDDPRTNELKEALTTPTT
jgi:lipid-binding SYLF domain-containing protein